VSDDAPDPPARPSPARRRALRLLAAWALAALALWLLRGPLADPFYRPVVAPAVGLLLLLGAWTTWRAMRVRRGGDRRRRERRSDD